MSGRPDLELTGFLVADEVSSGEDLPGTTESLGNLLHAGRPSYLVFGCRERKLTEPTRELLLRARLRGITVCDLATFYEFEYGLTPLRYIDEQWLLWTRGLSLAGNAQTYRLRRLLEFSLASLALVVTFPLMLLAAIAVKLDSPGPILFRQARMGLRGKPFDLVKFRSMVHAARTTEETRWTEQDDHRITRVGRLIRRFHLDELPQFWNVLRGDMSIVGPRPEQVPIADQLSDVTAYYAFRHTVRPGITGWAQIHAGHGASREAALQKLEYDLYYVQHVSLLLDLKILLRTCNVILAAGGPELRLSRYGCEGVGPIGQHDCLREPDQDVRSHAP